MSHKQYPVKGPDSPMGFAEKQAEHDPAAFLHYQLCILVDAFAMVAGIKKAKGLRENIMTPSWNKNKEPVSPLESRATQSYCSIEDVEVGRAQARHTILVDENPASHSDPRAAVDIEIKDDTNVKPASISGGELLILLNKLNDNEYVVQLPVSEPIDERSAAQGYE
ncbi:hypothetical protein ACRRTK_012213 [Alexandromys fortis]